MQAASAMILQPTTISKKKSSITMQIKHLSGKCLHNHYHRQDLNLDIGDMIKNKPSLS